MCTRRAARDRLGISKSASCVNCMMVPFGLTMLIVQGRDTVTHFDHLLYILDAQILFMKCFVAFSLVYKCIH